MKIFVLFLKDGITVTETVFAEIAECSSFTYSKFCSEALPVTEVTPIIVLC